jgi:hypothetical protein
MFRLFQFFDAVRMQIWSSDNVSLLQARDGQFAAMSKDELIRLRNDAVEFVSEISRYLDWREGSENN